MDDEQPDEEDSTSKLHQAKLTAAFFRPHNAQTGSKSRYFGLPKDAAPNSSPQPSSHGRPANARLSTATTAPASSVNLHPERRAKLPRPASPPPLPTTKSCTALAAVAAETKSVLPGLLKSLPQCWDGRLITSPSPLDPRFCPRHPPTAVRVLNADALDAALALPASPASAPSSAGPRARPPPLVLNMANRHHGGGGWLAGALAQEEALCYRSSLSFTLKRRFYPLPAAGVVYSPAVAVIRDALADGHALRNLSDPRGLGMVSVVSCAALRDPPVDVRVDGREVYARRKDEEIMRGKMRAVLRVAGRRGHARVVLGALGCGAFRNPRAEVCAMWREVLGEVEFRGWFEEVVFAVLEEGGDEKGDGNFGVFYRGLEGMMV